MKITEVLKKRPEGVSFEFFPPKTQASKRSLEAIIKALKQYNPLYVSMTYGAAGGAQQRTKEAVNMLLKEKKLVVMPHLTGICLGKDEVKNLLDEYKSKGIENIMALRGDPPLDEEGFDFSKQEFCYGLDLVKFIKQYVNFCIGVAVYPEGHIETSSLEEDLEYTKQKIDAGADFAVTQMFFDNIHYYGLLERMKRIGITIPVLPGIMPLTDVAKIKQFASICRTTIPKHIEEKMERYRQDPLEMEKIGVDFTIKQCQDLIKNGAKQLHFFTLNKPEVMKRILDAIQ